MLTLDCYRKHQAFPVPTKAKDQLISHIHVPRHQIMEVPCILWFLRWSFSGQKSDPHIHELNSPTLYTVFYLKNFSIIFPIFHLYILAVNWDFLYLRYWYCMYFKLVSGKCFDIVIYHSRFKIWCDLIKRPDLNHSKAITNRMSMRVCSLHFEDRMYMSPNNKSRLIWCAVPKPVTGKSILSLVLVLCSPLLGLPT